MKPVLAVLMRLLWAAVLLLPTFGAHAGVVSTSLYSFTGTNGATPYAGLVLGKDGNFYGTTYSGGETNYNGLTSTDGYGTVFKISTNGVLTHLYSFTGTNDGGDPYAALVQGSDGNFYGSTIYGGTNDLGTLFKISTNGALTSLYSFTGGNDGYSTHVGPVQGSDGYFYGTTPNGGNINLNNGFGFGTVFKISTNGALTILYSFTGGTDSTYPDALVLGSDGNFYGTTGGDFPNGWGTIFRMTTEGALSTLYSFTGTNGWNPNGLVLGSDGNLYGTTGIGGTYASQFSDGYGTVFKISTNGALTSLYSFTGGNDGEYPVGGLVQGNDGNFYGATQYGGTNNVGTVFQIRTNGVLTSLYSFSYGNHGYSPNGGLVQSNDGSFYGTTASGGGPGGVGTVFRLTIVPAFQTMNLTNGTLSLTWSTEAGGRYQLQYNSDLGSSNWTNLGTNVTAAGATLNATDSITNAPRRFYRVVLSPP